MLPLWHKSDFPPVPEEQRVRDAIRPLNIPPGEYFIPRPSGSETIQSPAYKEKLKQGPVLALRVFPTGVMGMGESLAQWFVYCVVVGIFAAYVASRALGPGPTYLEVFRFVGTTAFLGYSMALWQMTIWYKRSWVVTAKSTFDGLLFALFTAGTFGWLWPQ
jgi:hypothetical protein